jgi:hypothetical protein
MLSPEMYFAWNPAKIPHGLKDNIKTEIVYFYI